MIKSNEKNSRQYSNRLISGILNGSINTTTWFLIALITAGKLTSELVYKPTYYPKDPWEFVFEAKEITNRMIKKENLRRSIKKLQQYGLVKEDEGIFTLTPWGKKLAKRIKGYRKVLNKKWDGKYRMVIFDIPEKQRQHRDWLRSQLYYLEYTQLQKSVFISKYPLTSEVIKEIKERDIDEGVNYILADQIYNIQKTKEI